MWIAGENAPQRIVIIIINVCKSCRKTYQTRASGRQCAVPQDIPGGHIHVSRDNESCQSNSTRNMPATQQLVLQSPVHAHNYTVHTIRHLVN